MSASPKWSHLIIQGWAHKVSYWPKTSGRFSLLTRRLSQGDLTVTEESEATKDQAIKDLNNIHSSLRTLISIWWSSYTAEGTALFQDFLSVLRTSLADVTEVVEHQAGSTKESLRNIESQVQQGQRDSLGRNKERIKQERDVKVAWQHGMDSVKDTSTSVIGSAQDATENVRDKSDKTSAKLQNAYSIVRLSLVWLYYHYTHPQIWERAQSNPDYRHALDTIFDTLQKCLDSTINAASDPNTTLSNFIVDPTPEQHILKALEAVRTLFEHFAGVSLEPLLQKMRTCANEIVCDEDLKAWFDEYFNLSQKNLGEVGYAESNAAKAKHKELRICWRTLLEKDEKWNGAVENIKKEWAKIKQGLKNDKDLNGLREAHSKLGNNIVIYWRESSIFFPLFCQLSPLQVATVISGEYFMILDPSGKHLPPHHGQKRTSIVRKLSNIRQ